MNQDDATYTVTISGPGFSVTVERKERMGGEGNERFREQHGIETTRMVRN